jgi:prenyl protein peptidase
VLAVFGIRRDHLLQAVAIPLLLTSLVYAGSFVARLWLLANSCGGGYEEPEIGWAQRLAHRIRASVGDVMVWRNCVVVCSLLRFDAFALSCKPAMECYVVWR